VKLPGMSRERLNAFAADTTDVPIEETIWDVIVLNGVDARQHELAAMLADLTTQPFVGR
jgi:hypothetical protein